MTPAASVSGLYFAHPESHYFSVGSLARDQVEGLRSAQEHADQGGGALAVSNLAYDPE